MAAQLKLVRRDDFYVDQDSMSLMSYTDGFEIAQNGWAPQIPSDSDLSLMEVLALRARGSSHNNLAANFQSLDEKIKQVGWYRDGAERFGVWLRSQLANESNPRQALILSATPEFKSSLVSAGVLNKNQVNDYRLALERTPWWEDTTHITTTKSGLSVVGGTDTFSGVVGDWPTRLALVIFSGDTGGPLYKFWVGFRTDRFGASANFVPNWHTKDGTLANSTSSTGDANAKSGTRTTCTFGDASMLPRVTIRADQASPSNYNDQRGTFIVLLRAKVSDSGVVCRARLLDGLESNSQFRTQGRVPISSTNYQYYPLGTVQIPSPGRTVAGANFERKYALRIEAERTATAGAGALHMDCLTLIPQSEGYVYAEGGLVQDVGGDLRPLYVQDRADGQKDSIAYSGGAAVNVGVPTVKGGMPVGSGIVVVAAQRSDNCVLGDTFDLEFQHYQRWRTLRGNE